MNGRDRQGERGLGERYDGMSVCSAAKKAFTVIDYGGVKKKHSGMDRFIKMFFGVVVDHCRGRLLLPHIYILY